MRPFDFSPAVALQARLRQKGMCAHCGERLDDLEEHAHHVVPNQSGNPRNADHSWLASSDNCVVLCATCHYAAHEFGRYRHGAVAPPSFYRYSHGHDRKAHQVWAESLERRTRTFWVAYRR
jgi:5-methylcytosine-specific restriction endonuclease McrA